MKKITRIALLFCLLSPLHFTAQAADLPAEPSIFVIGEKATVPGSVNKLTRSFQVIVNNNDKKPIYCKKASITASFGKSDCGTANYGKKQLSFGPFWMWGSDMNSPVKIKNLGGDRLDEFAAANPDLADGLEYCYRGETELDCGYQCDKEGMNYGGDWTVTDAGGSIHFECAKTGKPAVLDMTCNPGYDKFPTPPIGPSCGPSACQGNHVHGSKWSVDVTNGKAWYTCNYGQIDFIKTDCTDDRFVLDGNSCKPKVLCDNKYQVGTQVTFEIFDGARDNTTAGTYKSECLPSGFFSSPLSGSFSCTLDYYLNATGSTCLHKSSRPAWHLSNSILGCTDSSQANSQTCRSGTVRWCAANGYGTAGLSQEFGGTGFAALCFDPDHIDLIQRSDLPFFGNQQDTTSGYMRIGVSEYCIKKYGVGFSFGLVHETGSDGSLSVSCSRSTVFHIDNPNRDNENMKAISAQFGINECLGIAFDETSTNCHALAHRYCTSKGFAGGYISGRFSTLGTDIHCLAKGNYRGIDY